MCVYIGKTTGISETTARLSVSVQCILCQKKKKIVNKSFSLFISILHCWQVRDRRLDKRWWWLMILCFVERICASWWYNITSTLILCNVSRLAYSSRLHLSFNTHLLNNIFWLLNFFFYNIFVYFGFGC